MGKPTKDYGQGDKAGRLIEFILSRKNAYYEANVTRRWLEACYGIECALDQKFTQEEEDLTRSKFYLARVIQSDDSLIETYTDAYTSANPLFMLGTKRRGTQDFAERSGWLMHNVWEEGESMDPWLSFMRDINRHGMGVGYTRFERLEGQALGMKNESMPWGMLSTIALQNQTLLSRAVIERFHPQDWWGYWRTHMTPPWEGVTRQWGSCEFLGLARIKAGSAVILVHHARVPIIQEHANMRGLVKLANARPGLLDRERGRRFHMCCPPPPLARFFAHEPAMF